MRLISTTKQIAIVERFTKSLVDNHIEYVVESQENLDWGSVDFGTITWTFWAVEEKDVSKAKVLFLKLLDNPLRSEKLVPTVMEPQHKSAPTKRTLFSPVCTIFLALCIFLFLSDLLLQWGNPEFEQNTPLRQALLFDNPHTLAASQKQQKLLFFPGFLPLLEYFRGNMFEAWEVGKSFVHCEKIQEGELWRLFTPSLLHHDIFHLIFNMFWLVLLGPPLERYLKAPAFVLFTLSAACLSNIAQYYVSGFSFLGASGIIAAYGGFLFTHIRLHPNSIFTPLFEQSRFLLRMILVFAGLSLLEILLHFSSSLRLPFSIANTAHCVGFAFGALVSCFIKNKNI